MQLIISKVSGSSFLAGIPKTSTPTCIRSRIIKVHHLKTQCNIRLISISRIINITTTIIVTYKRPSLRDNSSSLDPHSSRKIITRIRVATRVAGQINLTTCRGEMEGQMETMVWGICQHTSSPTSRLLWGWLPISNRLTTILIIVEVLQLISTTLLLLPNLL